MDEFNELADIDRLDWTEGRYRQGSAVVSHEDAVAALLVSPVQTFLSCDGL